MSLLRIRVSLGDVPSLCQWSLFGDSREPVSGEGPLAALPRGAASAQLVMPAAQVLIMRAHLPPGARRQAGSALAYAVEEKTVGDPDASQVSWLGEVGGADVLAVVDKAALKRWQAALDAVGIPDPEVHCETLLLPWTADEWSLAWDGHEGFVRTGQLEGAATDSGDGGRPPLSLLMMLAEAQARGERPSSIGLYLTARDVAPDLEAWRHKLGVTVRVAGPWTWQTAPTQAGIALTQPRRRWRMAPGLMARLRPAAWIAGIALAIQALALIADWSLLASEQRSLRQSMVARFRASFPDAVSVVDPVLQMRRKLADARHVAGLSDRGDFLPIIEQVASATQELPPGAMHSISYESGRMTLELSGIDAASVKRIVARLLDAGLSVDPSVAAAASPARAVGTTVVLTVRTL